MLTKIVDLGNSKVIKIPNKTIANLFPNGLAEVNIRNNMIEILPVASVRQNWDILFKSDNSERLTPIEITNKFDEEEWEW